MLVSSKNSIDITEPILTEMKMQGSMLTRQKGLTLVEILIALLIGVFLTAGVIQVFIGTKQTYRMQDALSRLQENGRLAMELIGRDIRSGDYRECPTMASVASAITGTNGTVQTNRALDAPDTINLTWQTRPNPTTNFKPCPSTSINNSGFDIRSTASCKAPDGSTSKCLYQSVGTPAVLVEGIENMQILYGIDTDTKPDGIPNYYTSAFATATDPLWQKVVTVRISLLLRTMEDNIAEEPLAYRFNGDTNTPTDNRIRRVFTNTFALRNRMP
jgi:type IV pilus assembly protein PilW